MQNANARKLCKPLSLGYCSEKKQRMALVGQCGFALASSLYIDNFPSFQALQCQ